MVAHLAIGPPGQSPPFDKLAFLKYADKIGKACRNQALELICICRVFSFSRAAEQSLSRDQDTALNDVLQACDEMLAFITKTDKMDKVKSAHWIQLATRKLEEYEEKYYSSKRNTPESVRERMKKAMERDKESSSLMRRTTSKMRTKDARVIKFHLLRSITDTGPTPVPLAFTDTPSLQEILWNFCFSRKSEKRVTLAENPHFYHYHHLPIKPPYDHEFTTDPMDHYQDVEDINVLTNKRGRVFLECGERSRVFDNVWKMKNGIIIFKDVHGKLDGEGNVGTPIQGRPCNWCLIGPLSPQSEDWKLVQDWRHAIHHVLDLKEDAKIRITIFTESAASPAN